MSLSLKPRPKHQFDTRFRGEAGEVAFYFDHVIVHLDYGNSAGALRSLQTTGGKLAQVTCWLHGKTKDGSSQPPAHFPGSPKGFPMAMATLEQVLDVLTWAVSLREDPAAQALARKPH